MNKPFTSFFIKYKTWLILLTLLLARPGMLLADTITVSSLSALQSAINSASPGDIIIVTNGVYTASSAISVSKQGTSSQPITIMAQTTGGVEIAGTSGFQLNSPAAYIIIKGFKFTHSTGTARINTGATHCTITRNVYECAAAGTGNKPYLSISGDDNEISYNTFQNKSTEGCMVTIQGPGSDGMAQNTWIHHNYFYNFAPSGANNSSAIQPGLSSRSLTPAHSLIEYNLFIQCRGENENIANKSSDNIYRYNTFGTGTTELSLRHGNRMQVYGNFFLGSQGLRFCADDHKIYSNYFEGCSFAINCVNGDGEVADGDPLTSHDRPDRVHVVFNTLVNNTTNYRMPGRTGGLGATGIVFANNIIQGGDPISLSGTYASPTWSGNILWNVTGGAMPSSGYTTADPKLVEDSNSIFHIQSNSPAVDASIGSYTYVTQDMDGHPRSGARDVGGDEYSTSPVVNRPLTTADVGPAAGLVSAPAAPGGLGAAAISTSQINLSWTDNSSNESNFRIERSANGGSTWSFLANVGANTTTYANTGLPASTTYHYRVRAENTGGNSAFSNAANATTQAPPVTPVYQAEDATIVSGVVESNHTGFNGTGFVNYDNVAGSYVQWGINVASAGSYNLAIRYANASGVDRPMDIAVNGTVAHAGLSFSPTTAWTDWTTRVFAVNLNAGINTIRATATTAGGGPNVDQLEVAGTTLQNVALNKTVTASSSDTNVPANAVDGNTTTRWSASPYPQWLEVDLGALYDISRTEVISYEDRAYQFVVESKTTSSGAYSQIVDRSTNTTPGTIATPITNTFTAVSARFVRITVTGASGYTGLWASLLEFRVFGVPAAGALERASTESVTAVSPNPVTDKVTVFYETTREGNVRVQLYNTVQNSVVVLRDERVPAGKHHTTVDTSRLPEGLHFIRVMSDGKATTHKVLKK